jgi:hypothetical protein
MSEGPAIQDAIRRAHRLALEVKHDPDAPSVARVEPHAIHLDLTGPHAADLIHLLCRRIEAERDPEGLNL